MTVGLTLAGADGVAGGIHGADIVACAGGNPGGGAVNPVGGGWSGGNCAGH